MAQGLWRRHPLTGLPASVEVDGRIERPDCDLYCVRSIAAVAGYRDAAYFESVVLRGSSGFHTHPLRDVAGRIVGHATHTDSAAWGGEQHRTATDETRKGNLRQFATDPSGGDTLT